MRQFFCAALCLVSSVSLASADEAPKPKKPKTKSYDARAHTVHTALGPDAAREASLRLGLVEDAFLDVTKCPRRAIRSKYDIYLYASLKEMPQRRGLERLALVRTFYYYERFRKRGIDMVWPKTGDEDRWKEVRRGVAFLYSRESFPRRLPIWTYRGLRDYMGEAVWTGGQELHLGVVDLKRLERLQEMIRSSKLLPLTKLFDRQSYVWYGPGRGNRDLQAWSVVHFLLHADNGKYRSAFQAMLNDIRKGRNRAEARKARLGRNLKSFDERYLKWWGTQDKQKARNERTRLVVETLTHFLARARLLGKTFADAAAFFKAAREGELRLDPAKKAALWLPESLLTANLNKAAKLESWSLEKQRGRLPTLVLVLDDGTTFRGTAIRRGLRPPTVKVDVKDKPATTQPTSVPYRGRGE